jgi:ACDE family multidrug resistance protein
MMDMDLEDDASSALEAKRHRRLYLDRNLLIVFGVTLMSIMGVANLTPALPLIGLAFGVAKEGIGLLIVAFTIPGIILTPILGVLADRFGRKAILIPSLVLFGVAGTGCAFAPNFPALLVLRVLQGVGCSALGVLNITIIGDLYTRGEQAEAMGYNASVIGIGTAAYPAIGGVLAAFLGWFAPFLMTSAAIPIAIVVLAALERTEPQKKTSFRKYLGQAWPAVRDRQVFGILVGSLVTFILTYGALTTFAPYLPVFGGSSVMIGLVMFALSIATALVATQIGAWMERYSGRRILVFACLLYVLALPLMVVLPSFWVSYLLQVVPQIPIIWAVTIPAIIFGVAQGVNIPTMQALLVGSAPPEYRGALTSIMGMVFWLGQTLGPIVMSAVVLYADLAGVFLASGLLALATVPVMAMTIRPRDATD